MTMPEAPTNELGIEAKEALVAQEAPFIHRLAQHIKPGGYLHLATDWQPYSEQMMTVLRAEALLVNTSNAADGFATKPDYRPLTKFENRGLKLGHGVWDLVFRRV